MTDIAQLREAATKISTAHRAELAVYLLGSLETNHGESDHRPMEAWEREATDAFFDSLFD